MLVAPASTVNTGDVQREPRPGVAWGSEHDASVTNGEFETPMCLIGGLAPNRDTLREVAGGAVLRRSVHPVVEF